MHKCALIKPGATYISIAEFDNIVKKISKSYNYHMVRLETENVGVFVGKGRPTVKFVTGNDGAIYVGAVEDDHSKIARDEGIKDPRDAGMVWGYKGGIAGLFFYGGSATLDLPKEGDELEARQLTRSSAEAIVKGLDILLHVEEDGLRELRLRRHEEQQLLEGVSDEEMDDARELVDLIFGMCVGRIYDMLDGKSLSSFDLLTGYPALQQNPEVALSFAFGTLVRRNDQDTLTKAFPFPTITKGNGGYTVDRQAQHVYIRRFDPPVTVTYTEEFVTVPGIRLFGREFFARQETTEVEKQVPFQYHEQSGGADWVEYTYLMPDRWWMHRTHGHAYGMQLIVPPEVADEIDRLTTADFYSQDGAQVEYHTLFLALHEKLVGDNSPLRDRPRKTEKILNHDTRGRLLKE